MARSDLSNKEWAIIGEKRTDTLFSTHDERASGARSWGGAMPTADADYGLDQSFSVNPRTRLKAVSVLMSVRSRARAWPLPRWTMRPA